MAEINEFNITEEELAEIEEIKELSQGCVDYLLESLINPETGDKVELEEDDKKIIFKLVLDKTMEYIEEYSFPSNEDDFGKYVEFIFGHIQKSL